MSYEFSQHDLLPPGRQQTMKCPTCKCTLSNRDPEANELHIASCAELAELRRSQPPPPKPVSYNPPISNIGGQSSWRAYNPPPLPPPPDDDIRMPSQPGKSMMDRFSGFVTKLSRTAEEKMADNTAKADELMLARWGDPGSTTFELCMRYWAATRMTSHWYVVCQTSLSGKN
jgi:hypothetical protein